MIYSPMVNKALNIMFETHKDQRDKSGVPYVFHPFHLAEQMTSEKAIIVALLHDTIEDGNVTEKYLREQGFASEIIDAVVLLTRNKKEDYFEYIKRIKLNPLAKEVKIADLRHNSDVSRLNFIRDEDFRRNEKYRTALAMLTGKPETKFHNEGDEEDGLGRSGEETKD